MQQLQEENKQPPHFIREHLGNTFSKTQYFKEATKAITVRKRNNNLHRYLIITSQWNKNRRKKLN